MRILKVLALPLVVGLISMPGRASAQVSLSVRLGPAIGVSAYSTAQYGEWRSNYRHWTPTTLYIVNGQYYRTNVRGARAVVVYRKGNGYFLPPQEKGWVGADRRYNYKRRPSDDDYNRAGRP